MGKSPAVELKYFRAVKYKHISSSDYTNSLAEPTPNLMCFPPFKTSSCSKLHILPMPTRLKYIVIQSHQEFVSFLHFKDLPRSNLHITGYKRYDHPTQDTEIVNGLTRHAMA